MKKNYDPKDGPHGGFLKVEKAPNREPKHQQFKDQSDDPRRCHNGLARVIGNSKNTPQDSHNKWNSNRQQKSHPSFTFLPSPNPHRYKREDFQNKAKYKINRV